MSTGASRFDLSFLWTQRKLISDIWTDLDAKYVNITSGLNESEYLLVTDLESYWDPRDESN